MNTESSPTRRVMWWLALAFVFPSRTYCMYVSDVDRQAKMTTCELITDYGYSCETSQAITEDGYVLDVDRVGTVGEENTPMVLWHRWRHGTDGEDNDKARKPIILVPGIMCESGVWFANKPSQSPGFILADRGYDVWAMNTRDIAFRTHSKNISQKDNQYWQWSLHEMGRYDIAAVIDLVLKTTGCAKVSLMGYSQGLISSLVLLSTRQDYNDKVDILIGYAPMANISHFGFPLAPLFPFADAIFFLLDPLDNGGYFHLPEVFRQAMQTICKIFKGEPCSLLLTLTIFCSTEQLNKTRTPVILSHFPIGTSYKNLRHIVQIYKSKNFVMYDYGADKNKELYGQEEPPEYPVERITVPVAFFSSEGDTLGNPEDVAALAERLGPALLFNSVVPPKNFRHLDFVLGYNATAFLHDTMIKTLQENAVI